MSIVRLHLALDADTFRLDPAGPILVSDLAGRHVRLQTFTETERKLIANVPAQLYEAEWADGCWKLVRPLTAAELRRAERAAPEAA